MAVVLRRLGPSTLRGSRQRPWNGWCALRRARARPARLPQPDRLDRYRSRPGTSGGRRPMVRGWPAGAPVPTPHRPGSHLFHALIFLSNLFPGTKGSTFWHFANDRRRMPGVPVKVRGEGGLVDGQDQPHHGRGAAAGRVAGGLGMGAVVPPWTAGCRARVGPSGDGQRHLHRDGGPVLARTGAPLAIRLASRDRSACKVRDGGPRIRRWSSIARRASSARGEGPCGSGPEIACGEGYPIYDDAGPRATFFPPRRRT